jgi:hypothetical protein
MGGIISTLFGGSQSKSSGKAESQSSNKAWDVLRDPLTSQVQGGANVFNQLTDVLSRGFDDYKKNAGFDFALNRGQQGITGNAASRGLLNSGSTMKGLAEFETGLGSQYYNNWLDRLKGAAGTGIGAGGVLTGAGTNSTSSDTRTSSDSNNKGIFGALSPLGALFG